MKITDFHTHVLPGIDDGSSSAEETAALLQEEIRQGIDIIVATPHFYANRISVEDFLLRREQSIRLMEEHFAALSDKGGFFAVPEMYFGAEVYFFPGMGKAEKLPELCIKGTRQILIEMPFEQWTEGMLRELRDILQKQKLRIVLAHVERYPEFQRDKRIFEEIINLPLTIQINGGAVINSRTKRKFCFKLLKSFDNVILGSDTHNMTSRTPNLKEARGIIEKKFGTERLLQIDNFTEKVINDDF